MRIHPCHISVLAFAALLGACKPSTKVEETTPKFHFPADTVVTACNDTLTLRWNRKEGVRMDSIAAGDTACLQLDIDGVFYRLAEINVELSDPEAAEVLFTDRAYTDSMFLGTSDINRGKLLLAGEKTRLTLMFRYHAKRAAKNAGVTIRATSQAPAEYNTGKIVLNLPVRRTPPPAFYLPSDTVYTVQNDTLRVQYLAPAYRMDNLAVGDEALMAIAVHGVRNRLKQLKITPANTEDATIIYPGKEELDQLFLPASDYDNGVFEMDSTFTTLQLPFRLRALKANGQFGITFEATTDAPHGYGISRFELKTPIGSEP